ncbi:MAG TPA: circularly permuted type 2 ATP-grasp protein, partial [Gemmata sp.]|nr:circularly permuted type 2 ATP-grasp protein [Gemmata sp.]
MRTATAPRIEDRLFRDYTLTGFDEMFVDSGQARPHYRPLVARLSELPPQEIERRSKLADAMMKQQGITFTVYGRGSSTERIMPFDPIPRLVTAGEWDRIERGLRQRVRAINQFIHDVYHERHIL